MKLEDVLSKGPKRKRKRRVGRGESSGAGPVPRLGVGTVAGSLLSMMLVCWAMLFMVVCAVGGRNPPPTASRCARRAGG